MSVMMKHTITSLVCVLDSNIHTYIHAHTRVFSLILPEGKTSTVVLLVPARVFVHTVESCS